MDNIDIEDLFEKGSENYIEKLDRIDFTEEQIKDMLPRIRTDEEDIDGYPEYKNSLIIKDNKFDISKYTNKAFDDYE